MNTSLISPTVSETFDYTALDRADLAPGTYRHYRAEIVLLIASNVNPFDYTALVEHAYTRSPSGRSNLKAALNIVFRDYVNKAKTSNAPVETIQRFLWLVEAMNDAIVIKQPSTARTPHWLSQGQVDQLTAAALKVSTRDYIVLGILLGSGVRCEELETLTFEALIQIPAGGKMKDVLVVHGKGDKVRYVPISSLLASHIREWKNTVGGGRVARKIIKSGKLGDGISSKGIFNLVRKYGALLDIADLDPHDCRRSYGRILYENTHDIVLVKNMLGHESVRTTQRYIGVDLDLDIDEAAFPVGGSDSICKQIVTVAGD